MYKDMYKNYNPEDFQFAYPFHFNGEQPEYLQSQNKPAFVWDYGDEVDVPIKLDDKFQGYPIYLTAYNFRYEPIYELVEVMDDDNNVYLQITSEDSSKLFPKGLYYLGFSIRRYAESEDEEIEYATTIIAPNGCLLQVV